MGYESRISIPRTIRITIFWLSLAVAYLGWVSGFTELFLVAGLLVVIWLLSFGRAVWLGLVFASLAVPYSYLDVEPLFRILSPFLLLALFSVLFFRKSFATWLGWWPWLFGVLFLFYSLTLSIFGSLVSPFTGILWSIAVFLALVFVPMASANSRLLPPTLGIFVIISSVLALLGIFESLSSYNPLASFYASSPVHLFQKWGVYRIMTTIGHPLLNATIFSVSATAALAAYIRSKSTIWLFGIAVCSAGVFLTFSRGGALGLLAGMLSVLVIHIFRRTTHPLMRLVIILSAIFAGILLSGVDYLQYLTTGRNEAEAEGSAQLRFGYFAIVGPLLAVSGGLGTGMGSSQRVLSLLGGPESKLPLESSALQLLATVGVPGLLLLVASVSIILIRALRRGAIIGPSMFVAYATAGVGFNLFEAYPASLVLPMAGIAISVMEASAPRQFELRLRSQITPKCDSINPRIAPN